MHLSKPVPDPNRKEKSASGKPAYCKVPVPATVDKSGKKHYGSFKVEAQQVVNHLIEGWGKAVE